MIEDIPTTICRAYYILLVTSSCSVQVLTLLAEAFELWFSGHRCMATLPADQPSFWLRPARVDESLFADEQAPEQVGYPVEQQSHSNCNKPTLRSRAHGYLG